MNTYLIITAIILAISLVAALICFLRIKKKFSLFTKQQNEFTAETIHELRSPLTVIKSSADLLIKESEHLTAEQIAQTLKQMEDSATGLLGIVNNLLDVAKIEAGKVELVRQDVMINEFLSKEAEYYKSLADKKGLDFKLILDQTVTKVKCDPDKIRRVLNNLVSNSIKFTQSGVITLESKGFKKYVQITVSDSGVGIPDDIKPKLFNKFTQTDHANNSKEKGTGLGLVIVKGMIEAHAGRIWIEDNKPSGTRFNFTLPLV